MQSGRDAGEVRGSEKLQLRAEALSSLRWSCFLDACDLAGATIWLVGCVFFLPAAAENAALYLWGCVLFIIGELVYIFIGGCCLREALRGPGVCSLAASEAMNCILGGASFLAGTILFLPDGVGADATKRGLTHFSFTTLLLNLPGNMETSHEEAGFFFEGTFFFVLGAVGFTSSSYFNSLGLRSFRTSAEQLAMASTTLHMGGGILFCIGSMGFISQVGCGPRMVAIGAWSFIVGCVLFMGGAACALARNVHTFWDATRGSALETDSGSETSSDECDSGSFRS